MTALHYNNRNLRKSFAQYRALGEANLALLKALTPEQWKHYGVHNERGARRVCARKAERHAAAPLRRTCAAPAQRERGRRRGARAAPLMSHSNVHASLADAPRSLGSARRQVPRRPYAV